MAYLTLFLKYCCMPFTLHIPPASTTLPATASSMCGLISLRAYRNMYAMLYSSLSKSPKMLEQLMTAGLSLSLDRFMFNVMAYQLFYSTRFMLLQRFFRSFRYQLLIFSSTSLLITSWFTNNSSSLITFVMACVPEGMYLKLCIKGQPNLMGHVLSQTGIISTQLDPALTTIPENLPVKYSGVMQLKLNSNLSILNFLKRILATAYRILRSVYTFSNRITVLFKQELLMWVQKMEYRIYSTFISYSCGGMLLAQLDKSYAGMVLRGVRSATNPTRSHSPPSSIIMSSFRLYIYDIQLTFIICDSALI